MLQRKVSDRLGCGPTGAMEMKRTLFFSSLDMNKVMAKGYDPEFLPPASTSQTDVRNFDTEFTNEQAADSLVVSKKRSRDGRWQQPLQRLLPGRVRLQPLQLLCVQYSECSSLFCIEKINDEVTIGTGP